MCHNRTSGLNFLSTNPSNEIYSEFGVTEVFKGQERRVMIGSRRVKSLSLGRLPWISPAYFKKTQASKLGDAQGIPFFIAKLSGHL